MVLIIYSQFFNIVSVGKIFKDRNLEDSTFGAREFKYTMTIYPSDYYKW